MKVTIAKPYSFNYGGKQYQSGDKLDVKMGDALATPWVFVETQDEVTDEQRDFLKRQDKVQKDLSDQMAKIRGDGEVKTS